MFTINEIFGGAYENAINAVIESAAPAGIKWTYADNWREAHELAERLNLKFTVNGDIISAPEAAAIENLIYLIKCEVFVANLAKKNGEQKTVDRYRYTLSGEVIALRNIVCAAASVKNFYCVNEYDEFFEFGFYDEAGKWNIIPTDR